MLVGAGILLSRLSGLIRQRVFAYYFSTSLAADAFNAAFRIPNLLQNLFGEGALSASFIPEYSRLLARGDREEANRLAGAVAAMLGMLSAVVVLLGVLAAPALVDVIAPGFTGERRDLTITLTRIFFPGAALLVLSAWCLGILNSHRRFLLSYTAPVAWNAAMIAALLMFGAGRSQARLAEILAWASVVGSALQLFVQLPAVTSLLGQVRLRLSLSDSSARSVVRNFVPAFFSRGVVQISAFVDAYIASWLPIGSVATLGYAQLLYTLPVSLFGMSVSAAELPAMSSAVGSDEEIAAHLRGRLAGGLRRIAFFVVPSAIAFLAIGDMIAATLYEWGRFTRADSIWVWQVLAGSTVGLLASTWGRLYASAFYALRDTRTPLRFAIIRVAVGTALGVLLALKVPQWLALDPRLAIAGITLASGIAAVLEYSLLRRALLRRIGRVSVGAEFMAKVTGAAAFAAVATIGLKVAMAGAPGALNALLMTILFGILYFGGAVVLGIDEARSLRNRILRRR